jgi:NAD(P)-dependent dehydrogenase (short-subunit alcohol dehydrogenase family)
VPETSLQLEGRVAVVTGGSRGIGKAIASALAREGARLVVSGRSAETVEKSAKAIGGVAVVADANDRDSAREPARVAIERFGKIDILVNNVGGIVGGNPDLFEGDDAAFEETLTLSLTSAFWATRAVVSSMRSGGYGRIINIGSGAAKRAAGTPGYTAAKHGMIGLTRQLAQDLAAFGITVNCVCPGWTDTDLVDFAQIGARQGVSAAEARAQAESESAQRRILDPDELGPLCVLLASAAGASLTGQVIGVDGGYRL